MSASSSATNLTGKVRLLFDVKRRVCTEDDMGASLECDLHPIGDKAPYNYHFIRKGEVYYELERNNIMTVVCESCYIKARKEASGSEPKTAREAPQ